MEGHAPATLMRPNSLLRAVMHYRATILYLVFYLGTSLNFPACLPSVPLNGFPNVYYEVTRLGYGRDLCCNSKGSQGVGHRKPRFHTNAGTGRKESWERNYSDALWQRSHLRCPVAMVDCGILHHNTCPLFLSQMAGSTSTSGLG